MAIFSNNRTKLAALALACSTVATGSQAAPVTFDGVTFPQGLASFADRVVSYTPGGGFSGAGPYCQDSSLALGAPDWVSGNCNGYVSLGDSGTLILEFTNNALMASGTADADLYVFEIGPRVEDMFIEISTDGLSWIDLGELDGQPTSIDIDAAPGVTVGTFYNFVKIIDGNENLSGSVFAGADIDAVGAISTTVVPVPAALWLGFAGLGALFGLGRLRA